jgi:CRISPR-associated protein, csn1 family
MSSYIDMKEIFGIVDKNNIEMIENIIEWITIFEDKKILKRKIEREYHLDEKIINRLAKKNYSGWSRLSKELLIGLKSFDDGKNIMEKLQSTKDNFMQIINNDQYGFNKQIEDRMKNNDAKITYEMVDEIPTSPANKRAIWQSVKIVKEITKIMKSEPKNIYVEFAREEQKKKVRKDNRAKALLKIYDTFAEEMKMLRDYNPKVYQELKKKQNDRDFNERLYLYFTQNGRCMYSSRPLNIDTLYLYEVDHILPQSYVKDDSLSNKALVYKEENQRKSGSLLLDEKIINKQELWWKQLHKNGLIDDKKLRNLTRRKMYETNDDKVKFVSRQLIETRQSIKYITNLLVNQYKDSDVFAIRAELTHNFRTLFEVYKNRNVNDYHHAQDAYIISVVGNVIDTKLHFKDEYKYTEYVKNYIKKNEEEKLKDKKVWIIMEMVSNNIDKEKVKKTLNYKDCFVTRKLEEQTGEFYKQTLYSPNDKNVKPVIPLKKGMNVEKYGGYSGENKAYFTIFSYIDKKNKKQVEMIGIPVKTSYDMKNSKITLKEYVESQIDNTTEVKIIKPKILKYQEYLDENNEPMVLLSDRELRTNKQLVLPSKVNKLIYLMNKEKATEDEKIEVEMNIEEVYNYLIKKLNDEYKSFSSIYEKAKDDKTKNKFNEMSYDDKVVTINGLLDLMHKGQGNLSKIGLGDRAGRTRKSAFKTKDLENMTFIDKSVTGIYERRYKVNGMENGSSK